MSMYFCISMRVQYHFERLKVAVVRHFSVLWNYLFSDWPRFARTMGPRVIPPDVTADPKSSPFEWGPVIEEPNDPKALKAFARLVTKVWKPQAYQVFQAVVLFSYDLVTSDLDDLSALFPTKRQTWLCQGGVYNPHHSSFFRCVMVRVFFLSLEEKLERCIWVI